MLILSRQVAGRYYKEADLTKSCVLCGGELYLSLFLPLATVLTFSPLRQNPVTHRETVLTLNASSAVKSMSNTKQETVRSRSFVLLVDQEDISLETAMSPRVTVDTEDISDVVFVKVTIIIQLYVFNLSSDS